MPISLTEFRDPPRVGLTITGEPPGAAIAVERTADGHTWQAVRGASGVIVPPAGAVQAVDWAAPIGPRIVYRLLVDAVPAGPTPGIRLASDGSSWLQDAFSPQNGVRVKLDVLGPAWGAESFREASWPQEVDEAQVMGASLPVESVAVRSRVGEVPIEIHARGSEAAPVRELLFAAGLLLVRGGPCEVLANCFVALPDVREFHHGHPHQTVTFTATARICQEPAAGIWIPFWTIDQVRALAVAALGEDATLDQVSTLTKGHSLDELTADPEAILTPQAVTR